MNNKTRLLFLALTLTVISACDRQSVHHDDIVLAVVDDRILYLNELKNIISPELYAEDSLQAIERYRNNWVTRQLKVTEARRLGLDKNPEVKRRIQKAEESILADSFNEAAVLQFTGEPIDRSEAQSYYENNKDNFILAESHVRYHHLMASTNAHAQNARTALLQGRNWMDVANQYAVNPQYAYRNSRQYWPISSAAREYEVLNNFLQVIGVTEISPIRKIGDHYHFVQLIERREAGEHPQIEWVIDHISEWLDLDRKRKHLRALEQSLFLRAQANNELKIFDVRLPEQELEIITDSL